MLTIGSKLGLGIAVLLILCILIGMVSYVQTRHVRQKVEEITEVREPLNSAVYGMENNLMETAFASLGYLATGDSSLLNAFSRSKEHFSEIQRKYRDVAKGDTMVRFNARLQDGFARLHSVAVDQILLRDQQAEKMHVLLKNLDAIDSLLNKRIQPSITADDPLAYRRLKAALEMEVNVNALTKALGNFLLTGQPEFESRIELAEREFARYFRIYQNVLLSAKEKKWATELHTLSSESLEQAKSIIALEHRRSAQLAQFFEINRELQSTLNDGLQLRTEASLGEAKREALHAEERANTIVIIVLFVSVGFGVGAGLLTTRSITRPLDQLAEAMHSIAHGDRVRRVEIRSGEDLRSLGDAFNLMTGHLVQANEELRAEVLERQRAEDALRISEEQFRLSIESVKDYAIFMLDQDGRVASWNVGAERMSGYPYAEILGKDFSVFYPPEDVRSGRPHAHLRRAEADGRVEDEGWRTRADGSRFWANVVMTAVRNQDGSLRGFSKVTRDATERKKMEEQIRESELRFRTMFEEAPIGIALADREGRFIQTNPVLQEMVGYSAHELQEKTLGNISHAFDSSMPGFDDYPHMRMGKDRYKSEVQWHRKDGSASWISLNVSPMGGESVGEPYSIMMMEDITERKTAEQQIRMLAHTITSMNESVVITGADDCILSVNPAFLLTFGYAEEEILGRPASFLHLQSATGELSEETMSALRAGGWTGELLTARKSGETFPVLLSTSVVRDDAGAPIALVTITRDITEQKRLQEQLEEAHLERSTALRNFAVAVQRAQEEERARISRELHDDLCQRLSGMKFTVEVLGDEVEPVNKRVFRQLHEVTEELDRTISEVRRISSNLRPSVLDDFGLVIALKLLCKEFQAHHGIDASLQVDRATPERIDRHVEIALYRIAQEALTNVAKHASAKSVVLTLSYEHGTIKMAISDDGKGFDREDSVRAKDSGHGFGLMIMRERSELLGGVCDISSHKRRGTTVLVTVPIAEKEAYEKD
ncbi:MAG TPA: PAS domain S-box protein [Bacteroidota bacterium]|nr:PAS domain S-box protein [Bacteroidota bacterium]